MGLFSWLTEDKNEDSSKKAISKASKNITKAMETAQSEASDPISKAAANESVSIAQQAIDTAKKDDSDSAPSPKEERKAQKKQHEWKDINEQIKFVCEGGKVTCLFCSSLVGDIKVTSTPVKLQDTPWATNADRLGAPNLQFKGNCIHPSFSPNYPPCQGVIQPGEWKDTSKTIIDYYPALLRKSTIPCMISGQNIQIVHSGQKAVLTQLKPKVKPEEIKHVSIGRIIRGNPYVSHDAVNVGLPDSLPLHKTYQVEIQVEGKGVVKLAIINSSTDNGNATINPTSITGTTKVTITGTAKTKPGFGGNLKIEATVNGVVRATSQGFSVCCHPINYVVTYYADVYNTDKLGVMVQIGWSSDNGVLSDLVDTEISEKVSQGIKNSPPFQSTLPIQVSGYQSGYIPHGIIYADNHTYPRRSLSLTAEGINEVFQLFIYKCKCCGASNIVMPNSGFKITHKIFKVGTQWKHKTEKMGTPVTFDRYSTGAGNANVISHIHNLP